MTVKEAASLLGYDAQTVRVGLQMGALDIGAAWKKPGNKKWTYVIYEEKVREKSGRRQS